MKTLREKPVGRSGDAITVFRNMGSAEER
jgi:hypothetical protein